MAPTTLIYKASGQSGQSELHGICQTCGQQGAGQPFGKWVKDSFTDYDKLHPGEIVCDACLFCFSDQNEPLQKRTGKDKPQKFRNYSHFVHDGQWYPLSKGQKAEMKRLLLAGCEVAIIADSGQKHLAFRAQLGWWQFEEQRLLPCPELLAELLAPIESLYNAGASKAEIESGNYDSRTIQKIGLAVWQSHEQQLKARRGGLPFKLAVFLAQKEEADAGE